MDGTPHCLTQRVIKASRPGTGPADPEDAVRAPKPALHAAGIALPDPRPDGCTRG